MRQRCRDKLMDLGCRFHCTRWRREAKRTKQHPEASMGTREWRREGQSAPTLSATGARLWKAGAAPVRGQKQGSRAEPYSSPRLRSRRERPGKEGKGGGSQGDGVWRFRGCGQRSRVPGKSFGQASFQEA